MDVVKLLLEIVGGAVVMLALAAFLSKVLLQQMFKKELEDHKAELAKARDEALHKSTLERVAFEKDLELRAAEGLERLRSQMQLAAAEQRHRSELLHSKRFEVIATLYSNWRSVHGAVQDLVKAFKHVSEPSDEEKMQTFGKAWERFVTHYQDHEILLDDDVIESVDAVIETVSTGIMDYTSFRSWWDSNDPEIRLRDTQARNQASERLKQQVPPLRDRLKAAARQALE